MRIPILPALALAASLVSWPGAEAEAREPSCESEFAPEYPYRRALEVVRALPEWSEWRRRAGGRLRLSDEPPDMPRMTSDPRCAWFVEVYADRPDRIETIARLYVAVPGWDVFLLDPVNDEPIPLAQGPTEPDRPNANRAITEFLRDERAQPDLYRVALAWRDLDGDADDDLIALFRDWRYCGSGGCTLLVFEARGDRLRLVSRTAVADTPIHVLNQRERGWHSLAVHAKSVGMVRLRFDGRGYPANASLAEPVAKRALDGSEALTLREVEIGSD